MLCNTKRPTKKGVLNQWLVQRLDVFIVMRKWGDERYSKYLPALPENKGYGPNSSISDTPLFFNIEDAMKAARAIHTKERLDNGYDASCDMYSRMHWVNIKQMALYNGYGGLHVCTTDDCPYMWETCEVNVN